MPDDPRPPGLWLEASAVPRLLGLDAPACSVLLAEAAVAEHWEGGVRLVSAGDLDRVLREQQPGGVRAVVQGAAAEAQLARANRLAQVGTMAMGVGHEINNPLTYVLSNAEYIVEDLVPVLRGAKGEGEPSSDVEELEELMSEINEGANHIRSVVASLGSFARPETQVRSVQLEAVINDALRMGAPALSPTVSVVMEVEDSCEVQVVPSVLVQVLINLLTNAVHAVQGRAHPQVRIRCRRESSRAVVEVTDNGCGIPTPLLDTVFEPFLTTKPVGEGTGIGLAVCRQLVADMGGTLHLTSVVDGGTTAHLGLPVGGTTEEPAGPVQPRTFATLRGRSALVVDDQPAVLRSLQRLLVPLGLQVSLESDPHTAAQRLLEEDPEFVLCDLMMPALSGMALYRKVTQQRPELSSRFVFVSGGPATEEARAFCAAHERRILAKPVTAARLAVRLLAVLDRPFVAQDPCPNLTRCPMFPKFQSERMLVIYKDIYCEPRDGTHTRCARYRSMKAGVRPSPLLLPHGEALPPEA